MEQNELERMVRQTHELAKENHRLLKKIRRASIISGFLRIIWWAIILGLPIIIYLWFVQSYVEETLKTIEGARDTGNRIGEFSTQIPPEFAEILRRFGIGVQ